eukprot:660843_1
MRNISNHFFQRKQVAIKYRMLIYTSVKRERKHPNHFGVHTKKIFSAVVLSTAGVFAFLFTGHRMYEKYTQKSGKQIIEKLASNQSDQDILNNIAEQIAEEYIMPQFNAHIANDFDLDSTPPFLHIKRELTSNQSLLSNIMYKPDRTAWNMCSAFGGSGSTFTIKNIYNHIIRTHKEDANKSF